MGRRHGVFVGFADLFQKGLDITRHPGGLGIPQPRVYVHVEFVRLPRERTRPEALVPRFAGEFHPMRLEQFDFAWCGHNPLTQPSAARWLSSRTRMSNL